MCLAMPKKRSWLSDLQRHLWGAFDAIPDVREAANAWVRAVRKKFFGTKHRCIVTFIGTGIFPSIGVLLYYSCDKGCWQKVFKNFILRMCVRTGMCFEGQSMPGAGFWVVLFLLFLACLVMCVGMIYTVLDRGVDQVQDSLGIKEDKFQCVKFIRCVCYNRCKLEDGSAPAYVRKTKEEAAGAGGGSSASGNNATQVAERQTWTGNAVATVTHEPTSDYGPGWTGNSAEYGPRRASIQAKSEDVLIDGSRKTALVAEAATGGDGSSPQRAQAAKHADEHRARIFISEERRARELGEEREPEREEAREEPHADREERYARQYQTTAPMQQAWHEDGAAVDPTPTPPKSKSKSPSPTRRFWQRATGGRVTQNLTSLRIPMPTKVLVMNLRPAKTKVFALQLTQAVPAARQPRRNRPDDGPVSGGVGVRNTRVKTHVMVREY
jgi:hypothetical protein